MKNGYPMWKALRQERYQIWYESGKWQVGYEADYDGNLMLNVDYASNTFGDCPELVESWSSFSNYSWTYSIEITAFKSGK